MKKVNVIMMLALTSGCGHRDEASDTKIVGGTKVVASDAIVKSTVALVSPQGDQFCTGSLISPTHVVTASHCLDELPWSKFYVVFGTSATRNSITSANLRAVKYFTMNEKYDHAAMDMEQASRPPNDVGFIQLAAAAPAGYAPVAMLGAGDALQQGETLTLAGFGVTRYNAQSSGILYKVTTNLTAVDATAHEIHFGGRPGHSACMGDSGGPAFVTRGGKLVLVGVTSRGSSVCDEEGIYTDLRYQRSWLSAKQAAH
jgi:secreted trypsin-like serine protease